MGTRLVALLMVVSAGVLAAADSKGSCPPTPPKPKADATKASAPQTPPTPDAQYAGTVMLMAVISDKGYVCDAQVIRGLDKETDKKASGAVRQWHFQSARKNGHAVPVVVTVEVNTGGRITGLEALFRWQHPDLGLVPPDRFIQIAEHSALILPIGEWVLRTACAQGWRWQEEGLPAVTVAVNVSAVQFRQPGFCELVRRVLRETGLAPQYLELELTESLLLADADVMLPVVQELKAMGVTLAIDDFGTGYCNFTSLRQFGVSKLKIDRSFIRDVAVKPDDAAITTTIIRMAKSLNLKVIAEGVEDEAQMSFLRAHHCDEIQGYYFSKPLKVDDVAEKLRGAALQALSAHHGA